jgi:L-Ala-D/L-Glu epimerase
LRIPFRSTFSHALCRDRNETDTIILLITDDSGLFGIGEILPRKYLTGETLHSVLEKGIPTLARRWLGRRFDSQEDVIVGLKKELLHVGRRLSAFAGLESAVLDLAGKNFGFEIGNILGPNHNRELSDGTVIDFSVPTQKIEQHCILLRLAGYRHVKVKVGLPDDLRRIDIVRNTLGSKAVLRLDANGCWSETEAVANLRQIRSFNIRSVEQPIEALNHDGMRRVRELTGVAIVADESLCSLADAESLVAANAVDYFNIRLSKCGGFLAGLRLVRFAHEAGLRCDLGSLVGETGILSRASEIFGTHVEGFEFLEGKNQSKQLLVQDIVERVHATNDFGEHKVAGKGLGIRLLCDNVSRWAAHTATLFEATLGAQS